MSQTGLLRAFVASELPAELQDAIQEAIAGLRESLGTDLIRWVPARNVHLTFKFLGDASPSSLEMVKTALQSQAAQYDPFDVVVEGSGAYPSNRKPRVIWVGLTAPPVLASLQHELDAATTRLGYDSEERGFSPHLTVGRVRQNAAAGDLQRIRAELEQVNIGRLGTFRLDAVDLFKSDLLPTGSVYTRLFRAPLGRS